MTFCRLIDSCSHNFVQLLTSIGPFLGYGGDGGDGDGGVGRW